MEELENVVRFEGEDGNSFDMVILKEFQFEDKSYAVLMDSQHNECDHDDCEDCEHEHNHEKEVVLLEVVKDESGNDVFKPIEDEEEYKKVVEEAEKVLFD